MSNQSGESILLAVAGLDFKRYQLLQRAISMLDFAVRLDPWCGRVKGCVLIDVDSAFGQLALSMLPNTEAHLVLSGPPSGPVEHHGDLSIVDDWASAEGLSECLAQLLRPQNRSSMPLLDRLRLAQGRFIASRGNCRLWVDADKGVVAARDRPSLLEFSSAMFEADWQVSANDGAADAAATAQEIAAPLKWPLDLPIWQSVLTRSARWSAIPLPFTGQLKIVELPDLGALATSARIERGLLSMTVAPRSVDALIEGGVSPGYAHAMLWGAWLTGAEVHLRADDRRSLRSPLHDSEAHAPTGLGTRLWRSLKHRFGLSE